MTAASLCPGCVTNGRMAAWLHDLMDLLPNMHA